MTAPRHTPGKFVVERDGANPSIVANNGLTRIADVYEVGSVVPRAEANANAALFATSPKLLSLLQEALEGWDIDCECDDVRIDGCWKCDARTAIAAARGES